MSNYLLPISTGDLPLVERRSAYDRILKEFIDSNMGIAEVQSVGFLEFKSACTIRQGLVSIARRKGYPVKIIQREDRMFLMRMDIA